MYLRNIFILFAILAMASVSHAQDKTTTRDPNIKNPLEFKEPLDPTKIIDRSKPIKLVNPLIFKDRDLPEGASRGAELVFNILTQSIAGSDFVILLGNTRVEITHIEKLGRYTRIRARIPYIGVQSGQRYQLKIMTVYKPSEASVPKGIFIPKKKKESFAKLAKTERAQRQRGNSSIAQSVVLEEEFLVDDTLWKEDQPQLIAIRKDRGGDDYIVGQEAWLNFDIKYFPAAFKGSSIHGGFAYANAKFLLENGPPPDSEATYINFGSWIPDCFYFTSRGNPEYSLLIRDRNGNGEITFTHAFRPRGNKCTISESQPAIYIVVDKENQYQGPDEVGRTDRFNGHILSAKPQNTIEVLAQRLPSPIRPPFRRSKTFTINRTANFYKEQDKPMDLTPGVCGSMNIDSLAGDLTVSLKSMHLPQNCSLSLGRDVRGIENAEYMFSDQFSPESKCGSEYVDDRNIGEKIVDGLRYNRFTFGRKLAAPMTITHERPPRPNPTEPHGFLSIKMGCKAVLGGPDEIIRRLDKITLKVSGNLMINGAYVSEGNFRKMFDSGTDVVFDYEMGR